MARVRWWLFSKVIMPLRTVFFILCKKQEQVTFLHVYHHVTMLFNWCSGVKYVPGGQGYYILISLGPQMNHYLCRKHYLSIMQLSQFVATAAPSSYSLFTECVFPDGFNTAVLYFRSLTALFLYFYYRAYLRAKQETLT